MDSSNGLAPRVISRDTSDGATGFVTLIRLRPIGSELKSIMDFISDTWRTIRMSAATYQVRSYVMCGFAPMNNMSSGRAATFYTVLDA